MIDQVRAGASDAPRATLRWVEGWDRVTWAVLGIVLVALLTRVVALDARAVHHDEALHLMYSWYYVQGDGYQHNPLMHGPFQFHVMAAFFWLFGDNDFIGRLPHALFGAGLVLTPLAFRRYLSPSAVVLAAVFLAASPALLYYSRFARNEPFVAVFTVLMVLAVLRYRDDGKLRWLLLFGAGLGLNYAAKETSYLIAAVFLLYLNFAVAHVLFWTPRRARGESASLGQLALHGAWLVPTAWAIAALWPLLGRVRERFGWVERPREVDLLVVLGTLASPTLAAVFGMPFDDWTLEEERRYGLMIVLALVGAAAVVGYLWGQWKWIACFGVFMAVTSPFYMSMGTYPEGIAGAFWTSLDYWIEQQEVKRANQPWHYYLMLVPLYEGLVLFPAVIGGVWLTLKQRDWLTPLLLWWAFAMFVALSYAGEKMPWLVVHITLPLCFLAAHVLGTYGPRAIAAAQRGSRAAMAWGGLGGTAMLALGALTLWTNHGLNVRHMDTPIEPFMYAQATHKVRELSDRVIAMLEDGSASGVTIDNQASLTWPWAWYLRGRAVGYQNRENMQLSTLDPTSILIGEPGSLSSPGPVGWQRVRYTHYQWPHEQGYRQATFGSVARGILDGSLLAKWWEFLIDRDPNSPMLYRDGQVLFPPPPGMNPPSAPADVPAPATN